VIRAIVGLGNIGRKYVGTRHNLGFEVIGRVAQAVKAQSLPARGVFVAAEAKLSGVEPEERLILVWPTTYMNLSGEAVAELVEEQGLSPEQILVVVDDFNLPLGALRFRPEGSDGGHNGLVSIIEHLGTQQFPRLRLGIGQPGDGQNLIDYVLGRFRSVEREEVERMVALAAEAVIFAATHCLEEAMSQFNRNPALPESE
jgi:peptidyl-tRNA hydrolase, PTH1 family